MRAHFIWLVPEGDNTAAALMIFSDTLEPDGNVPVKKIAHTKLFARAGAKGETDLVASATALKTALEGNDRKVIGDASKKLAASGKKAKDKGLQKKAADIDRAIGARAGAVVGTVFGGENIWNAIKIGIAFLILSAIGVMLMGGNVVNYIIGFPVVYILGWLSHVIAGNATMNYWGLEYVIFALIIGLFIGNVVGVPKWLMEAIKTEYYIKTGLVILGAGILFFEIVQAGALGIVQALLVVVVIWYICFWLSRKFRVDDEFAVMLSTAVSICGVSAAIAACGAIQGDKKKLSYVTSLVLIVAVPMMVLMPWIAKAFEMPDIVAGAWLGGTLDTSGSVVAAGALISELAMKAGVIVKFSQNVLIGIAAFLISLWWTFKKGAETPLKVTRHGLDLQRYWYHDLLIYVFDPTRPTELIDLWNLRLEPHPVLPVPIDWFEDLADYIHHILKAEYRPIRGNPQGLMHHSTIEFGRSIDKDKSGELLKVLLKGDLPADSFHAKHWRNPIWITHTDDRVHHERRLQVTADEQQTSLEINEERELTAKFETLSPKFAARFGGYNHRWVNAVSISKIGADKIATVLPFNIFDRAWPRLAMPGNRVTAGTEGWIFSQQHRNWSQYVALLTMEDAVIGSLKVLGIQAELSDPGHIAKQMLDHLGGLWGTHLLADLETLQLLNKMAGGVRRKNDVTGTIEETFERRSAPVKEWIDLIARRKERHPFPSLKLSDFTKRNLIRLGLETVCPHCQVTNWHSLTTVDYGVTCERCLNPYEFPQAELRENNRNWYYRVVGPFSVPD